MSSPPENPPALDDFIQYHVRQALEDHGVLTEARFTEILKTTIERKTGRPLGTDTTNVVTGGGQPVLQPRHELIPTERLMVDIRANDPSTWGPERQNRTQIIAAGSTFNFRSGNNNPWVDVTKPRLLARGVPEHKLTGYGLKFEDTDMGPAIHSFPLDDGTTLRFGAVKRDGRTFLRGAGQFKPDGYDPNDEYSLVRGEGFSDPLFFDGGPRVQMSAIDTHIRCGPGAFPVIFATEIICEPFMYGFDHNAAIFATHAPLGAHQSGPWTTSVANGVVRLWSKTTGPNSDPSPLKFPGRQPSNRDHITLGEFNLPEPGTPVTLICEWVSDVSGEGQSYCDFYLLREDGDLQTISQYDGPFGYFFSDSKVSGEFYPMLCKHYAPHKWWPDTLNYDSTFGYIRRIDTSFAAVADAREVSLDEVVEHALAVRAA